MTCYSNFSLRPLAEWHCVARCSWDSQCHPCYAIGLFCDTPVPSTALVCAWRRGRNRVLKWQKESGSEISKAASDQVAPPAAGDTPAIALRQVEVSCIIIPRAGTAQLVKYHIPVSCAIARKGYYNCNPSAHSAHNRDCAVIFACSTGMANDVAVSKDLASWNSVSRKFTLALLNTQAVGVSSALQLWRTHSDAINLWPILKRSNKINCGQILGKGSRKKM